MDNSKIILTKLKELMEIIEEQSKLQLKKDEIVQKEGSDLKAQLCEKEKFIEENAKMTTIIAEKDSALETQKLEINKLATEKDELLKALDEMKAQVDEKDKSIQEKDKYIKSLLEECHKKETIIEDREFKNAEISVELYKIKGAYEDNKEQLEFTESEMEKLLAFTRQLKIDFIRTRDKWQKDEKLLRVNFKKALDYIKEMHAAINGEDEDGEVEVEYEVDEEEEGRNEADENSNADRIIVYSSSPRNCRKERKERKEKKTRFGLSPIPEETESDLEAYNNDNPEVTEIASDGEENVDSEASVDNGSINGQDEEQLTENDDETVDAEYEEEIESDNPTETSTNQDVDEYSCENGDLEVKSDVSTEKPSDGNLDVEASADNQSMNGKDEEQLTENENVETVPADHAKENASEEPAVANENSCQKDDLEAKTETVHQPNRKNTRKSKKNCRKRNKKHRRNYSTFTTVASY